MRPILKSRRCFGEAVGWFGPDSLNVFEFADLQCDFDEVQSWDFVDFAVVPHLIAYELLQIIFRHSTLRQRFQNCTQVLLDHFVAVQDFDAQLAIFDFENDVDHPDVFELHVVTLDLLVLKELTECLVVGT